MFGSIAIKLGMALMGAAMIAGAAYYIVDLIGDKRELAMEVRSYKEDIVGYKVSQDVLMAAYTRNYDEKFKLETLLAKHDLGELAKKKPKLIEHRINSATLSLFKSIEDASRTSKPDKASSNTH